MSDHDGKAAAIQDALLAIDGIASIENKNEFSELPNVLCDGELPSMAIKCSRAPSVGNGLMIATDRRVVWLRKGRNLVVKQMSYAEMASIEAKRPGGTITFVGSNDKLIIANTTKSLTLAFADFVREKAAMAHVPQGSHPDGDAVVTKAAAVDELLVGLDADTPKSAAIKDALRAVQGIQGIGIKNEFAELPNALADGELPRAAMKCSIPDSWGGGGLAVATDQRIVWLRQGRNVEVRDVPYSAMVSVEAKEGKIDGELIVTFVNDLGSFNELKLTNTTKTLTSAFADFVREKAAMAHVPQGSHPDGDAVVTKAAAVDELLVGLDADTPKSAAIKDALRAVQGIQGIGIKNEFAELPNALADGELPRAAMKCAFDGSWGNGLAVATDQRIVWLRQGRNVEVRDVPYSAMVSVEAKEGKIDGELIVTFVNDLGSFNELKLTNTTKTLTSAFADFVREKVDSDAAKAGAVDRALGLISASDPKAAAIRDALRNADGINELAGRMELVNLPKILNDGELPAMLMACSVDSDIGLLLGTNERIIHIHFIKGGRQISWKHMLSYAELTSVEVSDSGDAIKFSGVADELRVNNATGSLTSAFADFVREKAASFIAAATEAAERSLAAETEAAERSLAKAKAVIEALRASGAETAMFSKWEVQALPDLLDDGELPERVVGGKYNGGIGILVATDRRLLFVDKGSFGSLQVEDFPYPTIQSVRSTAGPMFGSITIKSAGSSALIDDIVKRFSHEMANFVRKKAMDFNGTAAPVVATGTVNQVSLADELIKLSQLRESGILTDEEFQIQKARLLA